MTNRSMKDRSHGSMTVELVVLTPVIVAFLLVTLAFGRYALAKEQLVGGARAGADAVAIAASALQAQQAGSAAAMPVLQSDHACRNPTVSIDSSAFAPGGQVRVSVSCQVAFSDLLIPGLPGSVTVQAVQIATIDPYRAAGP